MGEDDVTSLLTSHRARDRALAGNTVAAARPEISASWRRVKRRWDPNSLFPR